MGQRGREPRAGRVDFPRPTIGNIRWRLARCRAISERKAAATRRARGDEAPRDSRFARKEGARHDRARGSGASGGFRRARRPARRLPATRRSDRRPAYPHTAEAGENASRRETRSRRGKRRTSEGAFLPPFFLDLLGAMLTDWGGKVEEVWWRLGERALSAEREAGKHSFPRSAGDRAKKHRLGWLSGHDARTYGLTVWKKRRVQGKREYGPFFALSRFIPLHTRVL